MSTTKTASDPRAEFRTYRYWTAGADVYYDHVFDNGGLRLWIDGMAGSSWYEHARKPPDGKDATFVVARALVAYRFGGTTDEAFYVEPFATAGSWSRTPRAQRHAFCRSGSRGVNVGYWQRPGSPCSSRYASASATSRARSSPTPTRQRAPGGGAAGGSRLLMFVVFEGIDGSGKTTVSNLVAERLRAAGAHRRAPARGRQVLLGGDPDPARVRARRAQPGPGARTRSSSSTSPATCSCWRR